MKKAVIIGASSGIGRELAILLSKKGVAVCATARRKEELDMLQAELPSNCFTRQMDVTQTDSAVEILKEAINELGGMDLLIISAGTGYLNPDLEWGWEKETIEVNVNGFTSLAVAGLSHFIKEKKGHLVGISSLAGLRGGGVAPAYNASKAFISNYLQGLRQKVTKLNQPIYITDIKPGFVDTRMAKGEGLFWVQAPHKAACQILDAIEKKRKVAYITRRWRLIAWLIRLLPDAIYNKM